MWSLLHINNIGLTTTVNTSEAQADWCDPAPVYRTIDIFGNVIWGIHSDGVPKQNK